MITKIFDSFKNKKIKSKAETFHCICWCHECDWELFPVVSLDLDKLQQEENMTIGLNQNHHNDNGGCRAEIQCRFIKQQQETTY
jgi:hypothetical protein